MSDEYRSNKPCMDSLCAIVRKEQDSYMHISKKRILFADTSAGVSLSLTMGSLVDYYATGIRGAGMLVSRAYAISVSSLTSGIYGYWREKVFEATKTDETSSRKRRVLSDLLAMNTFHTNIYTTTAALGTYFSEGAVNWDNVCEGVFWVTALSPAISITANWWFDRVRKWFKIPPGAAKAYKKARLVRPKSGES